MSQVKVTLDRVNDAFHFRAQNEDQHVVDLDASPAIGGQDKGFRPMQLLLAAVGSCSAIDIVSILKKQKQEVTSFNIEVNADRQDVEEHSVYKTIHLHFILGGQVDRDKAERAVRLSIDKYCSVAKALEATSTITYSITIR